MYQVCLKWRGRFDEFYFMLNNPPNTSVKPKNHSRITAVNLESLVLRFSPPKNKHPFARLFLHNPSPKENFLSRFYETFFPPNPNPENLLGTGAGFTPKPEGTPLPLMKVHSGP